MEKLFLYWDWVNAECALIKSDGCSKSLELYHQACQQHDLCYFYAKSPHSAYTRYLEGEIDPWEHAEAITKGASDAMFRREMQAHSRFGRFSPMSWWRFVGLKIFGGHAWRSHRQHDVTV